MSLVAKARKMADPHRVGAPSQRDWAHLAWEMADALEATERQLITASQERATYFAQRNTLERRLRHLAQRSNAVTSYWRHGNKRGIPDEAFNNLVIAQGNAEDELESLRSAASAASEETA